MSKVGSTLKVDKFNGYRKLKVISVHSYSGTRVTSFNSANLIGLYGWLRSGLRKANLWLTYGEALMLL